MYTMLSSEPETIHYTHTNTHTHTRKWTMNSLDRSDYQIYRPPTLPPVTEKLAKTQYFSFLWPV